MPSLPNNSEKREPESIITNNADCNNAPENQVLHGMHLILCIFSTLFCLFLVALDQTIMVAIVKVVGDKFNAFDKITWLMAAYFLATGCMTQVWGKISFVFGRKWIMIVGTCVFEIGSLICALSNSIEILIVGRTIQGIGAANIQTLAMIICAEVTTIETKPLVFVLISVVFTVASVIGPVVGGAFTSYASWRWCFYINLCFGGCIIPLFIYSFNPKMPPGSFLFKLNQLDYIGIFLMIAWIVFLLLALSLSVTDYSWNSAAVITLFVLGGVVFIGFLIWNFRYSKKPIILKSIVKIKAIDAAVLSSGFGFGSFMVAVQYVTIYFQVIRDNDAIHAGLAVFPMIISSCLFAGLCGALVKLTKHIKLYAMLSGILSAIGAGLLCLLDVNESFSRRVGLIILEGIGTGFALQPTIISVQLLAPQENGGLVLSMAYLNCIRNIICALFSQISQVIYTESLKYNIKSIASQVSTTENLIILAKDTSLLNQLSRSDQFILKEQFMKSIRYVFYLSIGMSCCSLISSIFMSNIRFPKVPKIQDEEQENTSQLSKDL